jgi:hypothetical protein
MLDTLILLVAFRHRVSASNQDAALVRFEDIAGHVIDPEAFAADVRRLVSAGLIYDPARLPQNGLQCHWLCEVTPEGAIRVATLVAAQGTGIDRLIERIATQ